MAQQRVSIFETAVFVGAFGALGRHLPGMLRAYIALFEILHDVQYAAISWVYNRRIVEKGHRVGAVTRYLFRPRGAMLGLYIGLVFVYGSSQIFTNDLKLSNLKTGLQGALVASTLLHFYFDGFIWKVRERSIRLGLGAAGGTLTPRSRTRAPLQVMLLALFCLPVGFLAGSELGGRRATLQHRESLVDIVPRDADARIGLAQELDRASRPEEAAVQYREAWSLRPDEAKIGIDIGRLYLREKKWEEASTAFKGALALALCRSVRIFWTGRTSGPRTSSLRE